MNASTRASCAYRTLLMQLAVVGPRSVASSGRTTPPGGGCLKAARYLTRMPVGSAVSRRALFSVSWVDAACLAWSVGVLHPFPVFGGGPLLGSVAPAGRVRPVLGEWNIGFSRGWRWRRLCPCASLLQVIASACALAARLNGAGPLVRRALSLSVYVAGRVARRARGTYRVRSGRLRGGRRAGRQWP